LKNSSRIICWIRNLNYLCNPKREDGGEGVELEKRIKNDLEVNKKTSKKFWWFGKHFLLLHSQIGNRMTDL